SCTCPRVRLEPLGADAERVFPWAGVVVLSVEYESYVEAFSGQGLSRIGEMLAWHHGALHFMQSLGSQLLQNHGLRLLNAGRAVLEATASGNDGGAAERFAGELRFLTAPSANGLTPSDLLESAAATEAPRLLSQIGFSFSSSPGPAFDLLARCL